MYNDKCDDNSKYQFDLSLSKVNSDDQSDYQKQF